MVRSNCKRRSYLSFNYLYRMRKDIMTSKTFARADFDRRMRQLGSPAELASLLNGVLPAFFYAICRPAQLRFFADTANISRRTRTFRLRKKHGGYREIIAPKGAFAHISRVLNVVLQAYEEPTPWACGFVRGRSVVDNARPHVGKRYVLSLDLKDFFPSITRQQVADCLAAEPFGFSPQAVELISGLCTARLDGQDVLAQGFATSPTLSNFVCREMDEQLAALAKQQAVTYTRYADDLTFSSDADVLRPTGDFVQRVEDIVRSHGFELNGSKTHLQRRGRRQAVTGLMVTDKVNVARRYVRQVRSQLYIWERYGYAEACNAAWKHYRLQHGKTKGQGHFVNLDAVLRGKLNYLKMVRGAEDALYQRLQSRYDRLWAKDRSAIGHAVRKAYVESYEAKQGQHDRQSWLTVGSKPTSAPAEDRYRAGSIDNPLPAEGSRSGVKRILKIALWVAALAAVAYFLLH